MASQRSAVVLLVVGTLLFGVAIALRNSLNPWFTNAALGVLVAAACALLLRPRLSQLLSLRARAIAGAIALAIFMVAATHLGYYLASHLWPALAIEVEGLYANIGPQAPPQAITVGLIALVVVAEELLWRGVAIEICEQRFRPITTVVLCTVLYTIPQLIGGEWVLILAAISAGGVFSAQRVLTKELTGPLLTHIIWSACIFSLLPLA